MAARAAQATTIGPTLKRAGAAAFDGAEVVLGGDVVVVEGLLVG